MALTNKEIYDLNNRNVASQNVQLGTLLDNLSDKVEVEALTEKQIKDLNNDSVAFQEVQMGNILYALSVNEGAEVANLTEEEKKILSNSCISLQNVNFGELVQEIIDEQKEPIPVGDATFANTWKVILENSGALTRNDISSLKFTNDINDTQGHTKIEGVNLASEGQIDAYYDNNSGSLVCYNDGIIYCPTYNESEFGTYEGLFTLPNVMTIDFSNFDTSLCRDMRYMFENSSSLQSLDLKNFNTTNVENIESMFYGCSSLTDVDLSSFVTDNVSDISHLFQNCSKLESLDLSHFNTSNITRTKGAFRGCSLLTSLNVSNWDMSNVTDMSLMFGYCDALETLDISNWENTIVENMASFVRSTKISEIDLSKFDMSSLADSSSMFAYCSNLETIYVEVDTDWTDGVITSDNSMFSGCTKLPNFDSRYIKKSMAKLSTDGGYFTLKETFSYLSEDYLKLIADEGEQLDQFTSLRFTKDESYIENAIEICKVSDDGAIKAYKIGTDLIIYSPNTIKGFDTVLDMQNTTLKSLLIYLKDGETIQFAKDGGSFFTQIYLDNFNTSEMTNMSYMFYQDISQQAHTIQLIEGLDNFDTSNVTDMNNMFCNNKSLTKIDLSSFDISKVTNTDSMFYMPSPSQHSQASLQTIYVQKDTDWTDDIITSSNIMFGNCVYLPNYNQEYLDIKNAKLDTDGGYFTLKE